MNREIFKAYRQRHGLSQKKLGMALGFTPAYAQQRVHQYETGSRELPIDVAYRYIDLAAAMGEHYTLEDLFPRETVVW